MSWVVVGLVGLAAAIVAFAVWVQRRFREQQEIWAHAPKDPEASSHARSPLFLSRLVEGLKGWPGGGWPGGSAKTRRATPGGRRAPTSRRSGYLQTATRTPIAASERTW